MKKVVVLGSFVMDLVGVMDRFPEAGESVVGKSFRMSLGGKGANQAISIKRLGGDVRFLGMVGKDSYGDLFLKQFEEDGIDVSSIRRGDASTGVGLVQINGDGQNRICIVLGANLEYSLDDLKSDSSYFTSGYIFLTQFEMDKAMTEEAIKLAKGKGMTTVVNPAPARETTDDVYPFIDYIVPNETEAATLTGMKEIKDVEDAEKAASILLGKGVKNVVVTLGEKGAFFMNRKEKIYMPSFKIKPVDTVGAGDSFIAAFVESLAEGMDHGPAMKMGCGNGALSSLGEGGIPALKSRKELEAFIKERE